MNLSNRQIIVCLLLITFACLVSPLTEAQQQTGISRGTPEAAPFLRRANAVLTRGGRIKSVAMSGSLTLKGTGSITSSRFNFTSDNTGQSRLDSGAGWSEFRSLASGTPSGTGMGPSGVTYTVGPQNPMTVSAWFFPALDVGPRLVARDYGKAFIGRDTKDGHAVLHFQVWQQANGAAPSTATVVKQGSLEDVYLDEMSHLPVLIAFNLHLTSGGFSTVPVQVHFSDYRQVQNCPVAYHIQVDMLGAALWDFQLSSATLNY